MRGVRFSLFTVLFVASIADAQTTTRISVSSAGVQGNSFSSQYKKPRVSSSGRYVAFESYATNLVPGDTNGVADVFVHDRQSGQTTRVSLSSAGMQAPAGSFNPAISADGRFVAFDSGTDVFVPGDVNNQQDIFIHDRVTGQTSLVSLSSAGAQANNGCIEASVSGDGRYVAFVTLASNLVAGDTNNQQDVFVRDRTLGTTTRVSVSTTGDQGNNLSTYPTISADGRFVVFASAASNLVPGDANGTWDVFVHDRMTGETSLASVSSAGVQGDQASLDHSAISADGRFVTFQSYANNLVGGDTYFGMEIFVRDRLTGQTTRENVSSAGGQANFDSFTPSISDNGRYVSFSSYANNLVPNDTNGKPDIFVRDRQTGQTVRVNVSTAGVQSNDTSETPTISANGQVVVFPSIATNLVAGDTNAVSDVFARTLWDAVPGDLNGDGVVNGADLGAMLGSWGPCPGCPADINGDGVVNGADLGILLANWT